MDYTYNVTLKFDKKEFKEIEDAIVYKNSEVVYLKKNVEMYGFENSRLDVCYINNDEVYLTMFSNGKEICYREYASITSMKDFLSIYRIDFKYKDEYISLYIKLEKEYGHSAKALLKKNLDELDLVAFKVETNKFTDLMNYINFLDFNSLLNILYVSYLIISYYILINDEEGTFILIDIFIKKLKKIGINVEENDIDFDKDVVVNLEFMIDFTALSVSNTVFTLVNLITYEDPNIVIKTIGKCIKSETTIYIILADLMKKNTDIHLL